jgi:hypothetical protein
VTPYVYGSMRPAMPSKVTELARNFSSWTILNAIPRRAEWSAFRRMDGQMLRHDVRILPVAFSDWPVEESVGKSGQHDGFARVGQVGGSSFSNVRRARVKAFSRSSTRVAKPPIPSILPRCSSSLEIARSWVAPRLLELPLMLWAARVN